MKVYYYTKGVFCLCKFFLGIILLIVVFIGCLSNMYISNEAGWIFLISLILIATGIDDALNNNDNED